MLRVEQDGAAATVAAAPMAADAFHPTVPFSGISSDGVPSALVQQLIAQMQRMQQQIDELKQQVQQLTARPTAGITASASSSLITASALCTPRHQSSQPLSVPFSIGQQLHKDALHCIFAYLSLLERPAAMRSCRAWYAEVRSLPPQNVVFCMSRPRRLYQLLASPSSPLARHIVVCEVHRRCTAHELAQLLTCLPNLSSLTHWIGRSTELYPRLYPSQLRELSVDLTKNDHAANDALIAQMENLRSAVGLRCLTLLLPSQTYSISLEPLECMKELQSLTLRNRYVFPPMQLVHIRRLPSLRTLSRSAI
jgi:cell division septum initiation protein DivIVA